MKHSNKRLLKYGFKRLTRTSAERAVTNWNRWPVKLQEETLGKFSWYLKRNGEIQFFSKNYLSSHSLKEVVAKHDQLKKNTTKPPYFL